MHLTTQVNDSCQDYISVSVVRPIGIIQMLKFFIPITKTKIESIPSDF